jgi:hypothetical protein
VPEVAIDRGLRDPEQVGDLGVRQAAEVAQLDDAGLTVVEPVQPLERGVEDQDVDRMLGRRRHRTGEGDPQVAAAALASAPRPRAFDEDTPHDARRHAQEVGAIAPVDARAEQPEIRLVDQDGRFHRMGRRIPAQLSTREAAQLGVDERNQPVESGRVAGPPFAEQGFQQWCVHSGHSSRSRHSSPAAGTGLSRFFGTRPRTAAQRRLAANIGRRAADVHRARGWSR